MEIKPFIKGSRIDLRPLSEEDVNQDYVDWLNDAEVCRYNSHHVFPYTLELAKRYVAEMQTSKTDVALAIVAKDSGKHIGNIALENINPISRWAEIAIIIGEKKAWGKGYGTEAMRFMLRHGFMELNLHRIWMGTLADNIGMQKIAIALGFTEEGRSRKEEFKDGTFHDVIRYGLLRDEFKS